MTASGGNLDSSSILRSLSSATCGLQTSKIIVAGSNVKEEVNGL